MAEEQLSTHLPETAGAIETVTGTLTVDTGLREVQSFNATLNQAATATEAFASATLQPQTPGGTQKLLLQVWSAATTPLAGVNPVSVSWQALGK